MARTRRQSTLSGSDSNWDSNSNTSVHSRSSSPTREPLAHIPRPPNSFILYRVHALQKRKEGLKGTVDTITMADFGKLIGPKWRNEAPEVKAYWNMKAAEAKLEHAAKYPEYEYHPNRGSRAEEKPKPAPCKPKRQASERKVAALSPTERSMKTRSMNEQRDLAAVRTGAQERKANADGLCQDHRQTRSMTRTSPFESDVPRPEDVHARNQDTPAMAQDINHSPIQSLFVEDASSSPAALFPDWDPLPSPGLLSLLEGADLDRGLLAHCGQTAEAFGENIFPLQSDWGHPGHDRPSLWDSDVPLFLRGVFEEDAYAGQYAYETTGVPTNRSSWLPRQVRKSR